MGSWVADLSKSIAEGLESVGEKSSAKIAGDVETSPVRGNIAYRGFFDPKRSFENANPVAKEFHSDFVNKYQPLKSKIEAKATQDAAAHYKMTGQAVPAGEIQKKAAKQASDVVFGENREVAQMMLKHTEKVNGKNTADILSDHLNIMFQEEVQKGGFNEGLSKFDVQMRKSPGADLEGFRGPISKYEGQNTTERYIQTYNKLLAHGAAAIHAATAGWNITAEHGFMAVPKAAYELYGPNREIENLLGSNAISELWLNPYKEKVAFDSGRIAKYAPGGVGEFIHKNMYIPGLADTRWHSIAIAAQCAKTVAEEAAFKIKYSTELLTKTSADSQKALSEYTSLSRSPDYLNAPVKTQQKMYKNAVNTLADAQRAEKAAQNLHYKTKQYTKEAFHRLDIDPDKIIAQGYKLHPEDVEKAYYHGANNDVFLHPYDATPTFWRQSPLFRSMKAFTGYITKQAQFKRNLYLSQMKAGDFVGLARQITLDSIAAPVAAATIYEFDRLRNGEDWDDPLKHLGNRVEATPAGAIYDAVAGKQSSANAAKITLNTINMYAKLGAFGTTTGYIRGLNRASLLQRFAPPALNQAIQLGQDVFKAGRTDAKHPDAAKPLGRDILSDIPFLGLGTIASHQLLPTRQEEAAKKVKRPRRSKQVPTDWNPLNYNPDLDF